MQSRAGHHFSPLAMSSLSASVPDRPTPFGYVDVIEFDGHALSSGVARVQRFEGMFPDGTRVALGGAGVLVERALDAGTWAEDARVGVFLATPRMPPRGEPSVDGPQRAVSILLGAEARDDYAVIKVAELTRAADGSIAVRDKYVPPCRRVGASPWLMRRLGQLHGLMFSMLRVLDEARRAGPDNVDINLLALATFNEFLPVVEHLAAFGDTDPERAYLLLCQFAGRLSGIWSTMPLSPHKFDRADLYGSFEVPIDTIFRLCGCGPKAISVPLEPREDGLHFGRIEDDRWLRASPAFLVVRSNRPERVVAEEIPRLAKIASWSDIAVVVQTPDPGVAVRVTYRPAREIPSRANALYFVLSQSSDCWLNVLAERTIAIYLPPPYDPSSVKVELWAVFGGR